MSFDPTDEEDDEISSDPGAAPIGLDANALERNGRRDRAIDRFVALCSAGRLRIHLGSGIRAELTRADSVGVRNEASTLPAALSPSPSGRPLSAPQHIARIRVRAILGGNARPGKHEADALHVSEAAEAGCAYFVTYDSRILHKRADLRTIAVPHMAIVTLEEFLAIFDRFNRGRSMQDEN